MLTNTSSAIAVPSSAAPSFVFRSITSPVRSLCFSPQASSTAGFLWAGDELGSVHALSIARRRVHKCFDKIHSSTVMRVSNFAKNELLTQGREGVVKVWNVENGGVIHSLQTNSMSFCLATAGVLEAISASTLIACTTEEPSTLALWDLRTAQQISTFEAFTREEQLNTPVTEGRAFGMVMAVEMRQVCGIPYLIAAYEDGLLWWDARTQKSTLGVYRPLNESMLCFALNMSAKKGICAGAAEYMCRFQVDYTAQRAGVVDKISLSQRGINTVTLRKDEKVVATSGWDHRVRLFAWKRKCEPLAVLKLHTDSVTSVEFSPTDNLLASADRVGRIALWNVY